MSDEFDDMIEEMNADLGFSYRMYDPFFVRYARSRSHRFSFSFIETDLNSSCVVVYWECGRRVMIPFMGLPIDETTAEVLLKCMEKK